MKYKGPCIDCGEYKDQQYTHKRCIACYQKFHRYNPEFQVRKRYDGPCIFCGTYESREGRFIRKMCSNCYNRFKMKGHADYEIIEKYPGPCIVCGSDDPGYQKYFQEKMCGKCYRHHFYISNLPEVKEKYCIDCGIIMNKTSRNDRCRNCHRRWMWKTNPRYKTRIKSNNDKYWQTEKGKESRRNRVRNRRAKLAQVENSLTAKEWKEILVQYRYKCVYCGSKKNIEMDHIIPISKGGPHIKSNVVPACRRCNSSKNNKLPPKPVQPVLI